jgi:tRNA 5-methylaminomethyl-2-thiouridine biosynthesis bifunctional protein
MTNPNASPYLLDPPRIAWTADPGRANDVPCSLDYDDIFWSRGNPAAEKHHVFVAGNRLPQRFAELQDRDVFTVVEAGFGFGIAFLCTAASWREHAADGARLHYIACENSPVTARELQRAFSAHGLETAVSRQLIADWPLPIRGFHRLHLQHNINLTLIFDDISTLPHSLAAPVDGWFLDGFSPRRNPDMWAAGLLDFISTSSRPGATIASYSVSGALRRHLDERGLRPTKQAGFGTKAEMLVASKPGTWTPRRMLARRVAVVGDGLAGRSIANRLAAVGASVEVFDPTPMQGASGVGPLLVYPQVATHPDAYSRFSLMAFGYAQRQFDLETGGIVRRPKNAKETERFRRLAALLPQMLEMRSPSPALTYLAGGVLRDPQAQTPLSEVIRFFRLTVGRIESKDGTISITLSDASTHDFDHVVLAVGGDFPDFPDLERMPLSRIRGRLFRIETPQQPPTCAMTGPCTLIPGSDGTSHLGSTWEFFHNPDAGTGPDTLFQNYTDAGFDPPRILEEKVGVRCATRDRRPVVGAIKPNLWALTGFGSHGATHIPICAEHLAASILGDPSPLPAQIGGLLLPDRFNRQRPRRSHER